MDAGAAGLSIATYAELSYQQRTSITLITNPLPAGAGNAGPHRHRPYNNS